MELHCQPRRGLWWLHTHKGTARHTVATTWKRITRLQVEHGLRPYSVTTFESRGGLHAHIAFIGNREIAERLKSSTAFGEFIRLIRSAIRAASLASISPRKGHRRRAIAASVCSVVAFVDHIVSTAAATVCASPAILSATQSTPATLSPGSTPTRDDQRNAKPIAYAAFIRARHLAPQDSFRSCPS